MYDITQGSTLDALEYFNQLIEQQSDSRVDRGQVLPVCLVAGNKCDLQSMRQVGAREGLEWARTRGFGFMETSAREMVNIEETFACKWWIITLWGNLADTNTVLVKRVVAARRQHLEGIKPMLPSSTARTRPLEPIASYSEKQTPLSPQWDDPEPLQTRWWHKFKCW